MKVNMHKNCHGARGVKMFNCVKCGSIAHNYYNGVNICPECLFKSDLCCICGKPMADKKPISSEENTNIEEDIYSKKYNIYEILTLIPNLPRDTKFKCSLDDRIWKTYGETTLQDEEGYPIEGELHLKEILEATYTIVKPVEDVKEKWVKVESNSELCSCIVKGKIIKAQGFVYKPEDLKASVLIDAIFDEIKRDGVWYLE